MFQKVLWIVLDFVSCILSYLQVLSGGKAVGDTKRYAVGILNNNELHLTKVSHFIYGVSPF